MLNYKNPWADNPWHKNSAEGNKWNPQYAEVVEVESVEVADKKEKEVKPVRIKTYFINERNGKVLFESENFDESGNEDYLFQNALYIRNIGYSLNGIKEISHNDNEPNKANIVSDDYGIFTINDLKNETKLVRIDYASFLDHLNTISKNKKNNKGMNIEQMFTVVLDPILNKIYTVLESDKKNTNKKSVFKATEYGSYAIREENANQIMLAMFHSHPQFKEEIPSTDTKLSGVVYSSEKLIQYTENGPGMSPDDFDVAADIKSPVYALEIFHKKKWISVVSPTRQESERFTKLANIQEGSFNIIQHILNLNKL